MSGLIGPVGGLESAWFTNSEPENVEPRHTYRKALSGRVTAQRGTRPRRSWACDMDESLPEDYHVLEQLARWPDPLVWYSSAACRANILTPWEAVFDENTWSRGAHGGGGVTEDGARYFRSRTSDPSTTVTLARDVAVPAGGPAVASVYVSTHPSTAATVSVEEIDPEGAVVRTHRATVPADVYARRAVLPMVTSQRTVAVRLHIRGALMVALPAITLTTSVRPWATGRGCGNAVIDLGGERHHFGMVAPDGDMRVTSRSFTIHELG